MKDLPGVTINDTGDGAAHRWATDPALGGVPVQLLESVREVFEDSGLVVTRPAVREVESAEYGACRLAVDDRSIAFRVAKTTPTKVGQFVTMWTRAAPNSEIAPFDTTDSISSIVVAVFDKDHRGLFIFNSQELVRRGIMSVEGKGVNVRSESTRLGFRWSPSRRFRQSDGKPNGLFRYSPGFRLPRIYCDSFCRSDPTVAKRPFKRNLTRRFMECDVGPALKCPKVPVPQGKLRIV